MENLAAARTATDRPVMSSKACAFSIAALVGDDMNEDTKSDVLSDDLETHSNACISPIGRFNL